jgi:hypothetical protein
MTRPAVSVTVLLLISNEPVVACSGDSSLPGVLCQDPVVAEFDELTIPRAVRPVVDSAAGHQ